MRISCKICGKTLEIPLLFWAKTASQGHGWRVVTIHPEKLLHTYECYCEEHRDIVLSAREQSNV